MLKQDYSQAELFSRVGISFLESSAKGYVITISGFESCRHETFYSHVQNNKLSSLSSALCLHRKSDPMLLPLRDSSEITAHRKRQMKLINLFVHVVPLGGCIFFSFVMVFFFIPWTHYVVHSSSSLRAPKASNEWVWWSNRSTNHNLCPIQCIFGYRYVQFVWCL